MTFMEWVAKLNPSEQAAWVQAIGSVLAIVVAIAVPATINKNQRRALADDKEERAKNAVLIIYPPIMDLSRSLDAFIELHAPDYNPEDPGIQLDPHDGEFTKHIPRVLAVIPVLNELPPSVAGPVRSLLAELVDFDHWLQSIPAIERSGSPAFYRNNIDYIRERAEELDKYASTAMDAAYEKLHGKKPLSG
ncbi:MULTISPECIES: hypothetical protein [unclassified Pseudomonas]|nr:MULTISPECIES: hypothetical protein [unclassified Pseudomonas]MBW5416087.1 hypothetical protein [Pseudomonas sp. MAG002Y]